MALISKEDSCVPVNLNKLNFIKHAKEHLRINIIKNLKVHIFHTLGSLNSADIYSRKIKNIISLVFGLKNKIIKCIFFFF